MPYEAEWAWNVRWFFQHLAFRQHSPGMYEHCQQLRLWVILTKISKTTYWFRVSTSLRYENRIHIFPLHDHSRHFIPSYMHREPVEGAQGRWRRPGVGAAEGSGSSLPVTYNPVLFGAFMPLKAFLHSILKFSSVRRSFLGNLKTIVWGIEISKIKNIYCLISDILQWNWLWLVWLFNCHCVKVSTTSTSTSWCHCFNSC